MYRVFLQRQSPLGYAGQSGGYAVPAWMDELTQGMEPEQKEAAHKKLFAVRLCLVLRQRHALYNISY